MLTDSKTELHEILNGILDKFPNHHHVIKKLMTGSLSILIQKEIINQAKQEQNLKSLDGLIDKFLSTYDYAYNHKINAFYRIKPYNIVLISSESILLKFRKFVMNYARPVAHLRREGCVKLKRKLKCTRNFFSLVPTDAMQEKVTGVFEILQIGFPEIQYILYCIGALLSRKMIPKTLWFGSNVDILENLFSQVISKTYSYINEFHFMGVVHKITNGHQLSRYCCIEFPRIHTKTFTRFVGLCEKYSHSICIVSLNLFRTIDVGCFDVLKRFGHLKNCNVVLRSFDTYKKTEKPEIIYKRLVKKTIDGLPIELIDPVYLLDYIQNTMLDQP